MDGVNGKPNDTVGQCQVIKGCNQERRRCPRRSRMSSTAAFSALSGAAQTSATSVSKGFAEAQSVLLYLVMSAGLFRLLKPS